jgi:hypothetical protein
LDTAAASAGVAADDIGACTIGVWIESRSVRTVVMLGTWILVERWPVVGLQSEKRVWLIGTKCVRAYL